MKPLSAIPTKWTKTLTQFVSQLPTNCLSVFGYFVFLALKGLINLLKCDDVIKADCPIP